MRVLQFVLVVLVASWAYDNLLPDMQAMHVDFSSLFLGAFGACVAVVILLRFFQHRWVDAETAAAIRKIKEGAEARKW